MARKTSITKIYEINDIFAVVGYALLTMGVIGWLNAQGITQLNVEVIPVDSLWGVFKGLFNFSATGNIVSLIVGVMAVLTDKYIRYKRFF